MRKLKILVVDDEQTLLDLYTEILPFEIVTAPNGKEGFKKFKECRPDIVLSDYKMPVENGLGMCLDILRIDPLAKIIVVSGFFPEELTPVINSICSVPFFRKPVEWDELIKCIKKLGEDTDLTT